MSVDEKQPLLSSGGPQDEATITGNLPPYEEPARLGTLRFSVVYVVLCLVRERVDLTFHLIGGAGGDVWANWGGGEAFSSFCVCRFVREECQ